MKSPEKEDFIERHKLPQSYLDEASIWFDPLIETLIKHQLSAKTPLIIGINGSQGSGKTTLADYLSSSFIQRGLKSVALSIDDFYLDHQERLDLASKIHPLLATRGVPGTHNLQLAFDTLASLQSSRENIALPRFDKSTDNKAIRNTWPIVDGPVDIIIIEGWCLGIPAQSQTELITPINTLESDHDTKGVWRNCVNEALSNQYQSLWRQLDKLIMLKAPHFNCVYQWRLEQERKLLKKYETSELPSSHKIMSPEEVALFIQHYERLTRHALAYLPDYCEHIYELDEDRHIKSHKQNEQAKTF